MPQNKLVEILVEIESIKLTTNIIAGYIDFQMMVIFR